MFDDSLCKVGCPDRPTQSTSSEIGVCSKEKRNGVKHVAVSK